MKEFILVWDSRNVNPLWYGVMVASSRNRKLRYHTPTTIGNQREQELEVG